MCMNAYTNQTCTRYFGGIHKLSQAHIFFCACFVLFWDFRTGFSPRFLSCAI